MFNCPPMTPELTALLEKAKRDYEAMTPEQRENMHCAQRKSWVRAEMSWPKPRFKYVNGVKVYASYEDYCND